VATPGVREALKDASRVADLRKYMADGRNQLGTQTFDQHVTELVEAGLITQDTAKAALSMSTSSAASAKKGPKQAASA
jgi:Tfp pilus assembly pilus retraction ATPase PilT